MILIVIFVLDLFQGSVRHKRPHSYLPRYKTKKPKVDNEKGKKPESNKRENKREFHKKEFKKKNFKRK